MTAAAQLSAVMKTLADPTRRAVFERIASEREIAATALVKGSASVFITAESCAAAVIDNT